MQLNATSKIIFVAPLAAIAIFCALPAGRVSALPSCPTCQNLRFSFGMVGITAGQTAHLSVVNAMPVGPPILPSRASTAHLDLMFVDASGNPFTVGGAVSHTTVALGPGQSACLDLNGDAIPIGPPVIPSGPPTRVQVRALIPGCDGCNQGFVIPTLEVFDNVTGKTTLVMPDTPAITRGQE